MKQKKKKNKKRIDRLNTSSSQHVVNYRNKSPTNVLDDETDTEPLNGENYSPMLILH